MIPREWEWFFDRQDHEHGYVLGPFWLPGDAIGIGLWFWSCGLRRA